MPVEVSDAPMGIDQLDPLGVAMQDIAVAVVPLEAYGSEPDGVALDRGPLPLEGLGLVAVAIGDGPALEGLAGLGVDLVGDAGVVAEGDQQPVVEHQLRKLHGPVPSRCGGTQLELLVPRQHESLLLHSAIDPEHPALLEVGAPDELLRVPGHEVQICDHTETVLRLNVAQRLGPRLHRPGCVVREVQGCRVRTSDCPPSAPATARVGSATSANVSPPNFGPSTAC
mmetsp:Transcript_96876/g.278218  ORF Transcript_96876/g.278218 Transcript_96876/m.278218 type:complete len:226 (-) Transcript_96876:288-965(-)